MHSFGGWEVKFVIVSKRWRDGYSAINNVLTMEAPYSWGVKDFQLSSIEARIHAYKLHQKIKCIFIRYE